MADTNVEVSAKADTDVEVSAMADINVEEAAMADTKVEEAAMADTNVEVAAMADTDVEEIAAMADTNVEMAAAARTDVFGEAITHELLMEIPEFANRARKDRSDVAKQWKNKDGKYDEVVRYVRQLKAQWGTGVSTLCMVYNGTGEPLRFVTSNDWFGQIYLTYPRVIANGQWGGFLHVKRTAAASGSQAAAVYRGKNKDGEDTDFMVAWDNPWNRARFDNNVMYLNSKCFLQKSKYN